MGMNLEQSILARISRVRLFAFDVDGVLTDGGLYMGDSGEVKRFDVQDGAGIAIALRAGFPVAFISGRDAESVRRRAAELGVKEVHQGVKNKIVLLDEIATRHGMEPEQIAFMGDDLPDLAVFHHVGLASAPASAALDLRARAHYVTARPGGGGAVREIIEVVLRNQGHWDAVVEHYIQTGDRVAQ